MINRTAWPLAFFAWICVSCSNQDANPQTSAAQPSAPPAATAEPQSISPESAPAANPEEGAAIARARAVIAKYKLTSITPDCLKLEIDNTTADNYEMTVYETHNQQCGGDPDAQPRLFAMQVARVGTKVWSDAKSEDGELELIQE